MTPSNPTQQLRTAAAFLTNQTPTSSSVQQATQQIRQLFTNANNSLQAQQTTNTQRLTEAAQRSPSSVSISNSILWSLQMNVEQYFIALKLENNSKKLFVFQFILMQYK